MVIDPGKIIVIDDDAGVRESLDALLTAKGFVCRHYENGEAFLSASDASDPAIILMDHSLGGLTGMQAIKQLRSEGDRRPIIMITGQGDLQFAVDAMRAGASDFIEKPWEKDALFQAIERVVGHARSAAQLAESRQNAIDVINTFTPREKDVFDQLIQGASNKQAGRALDLSPRTVEFYRANLFEKAGVTSVAELVRLAFMAKGAQL